MNIILYLMLLFPPLTLAIHSDLNSACRRAAEAGKAYRHYAWRLEIVSKDCSATSDPEFIQCLIQVGGWKLTRGRCQEVKQYELGERPQDGP